MAESIRGMSNLKQAFKDLVTIVERNQEIALKLVATQYKNDVQRLAPYDTGTLRRSIHVEMINSGSALVGTDLPYARRQEYGFVDKDKRGMEHGREYQYNLGNGHSEPRISWRASVLYACGLKRDLAPDQVMLPQKSQY